MFSVCYSARIGQFFSLFLRFLIDTFSTALRENLLEHCPNCPTYCCKYYAANNLDSWFIYFEVHFHLRWCRHIVLYYTIIIKG